MKRIIFLTLSSLIFAGFFMSTTAYADSGKRYAVTFTNLTQGQVITPPVLIVHNDGFYLFTLGSPAVPELAALAEDGVTAPLVNLAGSMPSVANVLVSSGPLLPGSSVTLEFASDRQFSQITAAGMLATSNDAFFAIRNIPLPEHGFETIYAAAYDAGSEGNSESCEFIPGPPCGHAGMRDTGSAEGYVYVHSGIHGMGDLLPSMFDWNNPVVEITIERMP
ncbi:MAG: spondin domain-containing protein [Nitrospirae bacterium]|nr:spondin domain-containing protein [Nitrospirota bacterium]